MSEAPDKPEDQASDQAQRDQEEHPQRRKVTEDELKEALEAHKRWVWSDGKEGEKADLGNTDLEGANLQGAHLSFAKLQKAKLGDAKLQKANLQGANLQGAHLSRAKLQGAHLSFANLQKADLGYANLQGAHLRGANLRGADLREAKGLTQEQLDRACGDAETKLPDSLKDYKIKPCPEEGK